MGSQYSASKRSLVAPAANLSAQKHYSWRTRRRREYNLSILDPFVTNNPFLLALVSVLKHDINVGVYPASICYRTERNDLLGYTIGTLCDDMFSNLFTRRGKAQKNWRSKAWLIDLRRTRIYFTEPRPSQHLPPWLHKKWKKNQPDACAKNRFLKNIFP